MKFLLSEYKNFVGQLIAQGYSCLPFSSPAARDIVGRNLLLRHDIDIDPLAALEMAKAENSVGAKSTYFVLLSNRHTNPLDKTFRKAVQELAELGHWIGLHFDATQYDLRPEDPKFPKYVEKEVELLEWTTGISADSVSFHRPARELLGAPGSLAGIRSHTYENVFLREIEYCSDSSGKWAYGPPEEREAPKLGKPFHFLTHPIWWGEDDVEPLSRVSRWMSKRVAADFSYELPNTENPFGGPI